MLDYLSGKTDRSPHHEFIYLNDAAEVVAILVGDWKIHLRAIPHGPTPSLARALRLPACAPMLANLRRDPFEKAQKSATNYNDWCIDRAFVLVLLQGVASKFLMTLKDFPPSQKPGDWGLDSLEKQIKAMTPSTR